MKTEGEKGKLEDEARKRGRLCFFLLPSAFALCCATGFAVAQQKFPTKPVRIPVPFALERDVGLGEFVKRATTAVGVKPCGGCGRRAELLNRHVVLTGRKVLR